MLIYLGEGEYIDGENRLDSNKQTDVVLPNDVQAREDLGSGQGDNNAEESPLYDSNPKSGQGFQESSTERPDSRLDTVGRTDEKIAQTDEEGCKEPDADMSNAVEEHVAKVHSNR